MANTFNPEAKTTVSRSVERMHDVTSDYIIFLKQIKADIAVNNFINLKDIPHRTAHLFRQKASFDALGLSGPQIKGYLEDYYPYTNWTATHTADFNAIFTNAQLLRDVVVDIINGEVDPPDFLYSVDENDKFVFNTATEAHKTAVENAIDVVLASSM